MDDQHLRRITTILETHTRLLRGIHEAVTAPLPESRIPEVLERLCAGVEQLTKSVEALIARDRG